jgi:hypothetical protein
MRRESGSDCIADEEIEAAEKEVLFRASGIGRELQE